jgi:alpha-1,2-mannosyltransferase
VPSPEVGSPIPDESRASDGGLRLAGGDRSRMYAVVAVISVAVALVVVLPQTESPTGLLDGHIYLGAARQLAAGRSVYDFHEGWFNLGSTYPPLWSLLVYPFTLVHVDAVLLVWTAVNLGLWFAILSVCARSAGARPLCPDWFVVVVWAVTVPSSAVWNTLNQGQVNLLIWLLVILDLRAVIGGRRWSGMLIGLAAAIKVQPALVAVLLLVAGRWRSAARAAAAAVAATALAALVLPQDSWDYWTERVFDTSLVGPLGDGQNNSLRSLVERGILAGNSVGRLLALVATVVVLGLAAVMFRRALARECLIVAAVTAGTAIVLVTPVSWTHHLVFLGVLLLLLYGPDLRGWRLAAAVGAAALVLLDPIGFGRSEITTTVRTLGLVALLVAAPVLIEREAALRARARARWQDLSDTRHCRQPAGG